MIATGEPAKALERAEALVCLAAGYAEALYNAACVFALAGEPDRAIETLRLAIEAEFGYREWLEADSDLDSLRDHPGYPRLLDLMP